jgi:hypothetical protein
MSNGALPNTYYVYVVAQGVIYRYDLTFDQLSKKLFVKTTNQYLNSNLDGTLYSIKVCDLGIAVACANCTSPFVAVYDLNFNQKFTVPVQK